VLSQDLFLKKYQALGPWIDDPMKEAARSHTKLENAGVFPYE